MGHSVREYLMRQSSEVLEGIAHYLKDDLPDMVIDDIHEILANRKQILEKYSKGRLKYYSTKSLLGLLEKDELLFEDLFLRKIVCDEILYLLIMRDTKHPMSCREILKLCTQSKVYRASKFLGIPYVDPFPRD